MTKSLADASRTFFKNAMSARAYDFALTPTLISDIEKVRQEIRAEEGGGGMCHLVSEYLQSKFPDWERLYMSYLTTDGELICAGGHVVNLLPDGSILDSTRDQFGEGFSVSHIKIDSDEIGRYRPEFYQDYYPGHPDIGGSLDMYLDHYSGTPDDQLPEPSKTPGWWLADTTLYEQYLSEQDNLSQSVWGHPRR